MLKIENKVWTWIFILEAIGNLFLLVPLVIAFDTIDVGSYNP